MAKPTFGVIGGSRAYDLLAQNSFGTVRATNPVTTPFGESAPIHLFEKDGYSYRFLSRHGEEGYEVTAPFVNYRANIWAMAELGIKQIISWSQPGSLNQRLNPGDLVIPDDIIDSSTKRESTYYKNSGLGFIRMSNPFCPEIREELITALYSAGNCDYHNDGVYLCTEGPRLETPAEIKMYRKWGADMVGMTLATEAFLARELEICYSSICLISNFAEGIKERSFKEGELFEGMLREDEKNKVERSITLLPEILETTLQKLSGAKRTCDCGKAMERYRKNGKIGDDLLAEIRSFSS